MNTKLKLATIISLGLMVTACGSSDETTDNTGKEGNGSAEYKIVSGINAYSDFAYYDLDTQQQLTLTTEQAKANTEWDVAFYGTSIILNGDQSGPGDVQAYFTGNNADFYDAEGVVVADKFVNATPESELADFLAVTEYPANTQFTSDYLDTVFGSGFYQYNPMNHEISANDAQYYLLSNEDGLYKVRVTSTSNLNGGVPGMSMTDITLGYQFKGADDQTFAAEQTLQIAQCDTQHYVDFSANSEVANTGAWDISVLCNEFEIQLGTGAKAVALSGDASDDAVIADPDANVKADAVKTVFKGQDKWYAYNLQGNHKIWSQYGVYLVKTPTATYKLQVTGYYGLVDNEVSSRIYSFIYDTVTQAIE